jgi:hypothetical protein
MWPSSLPSRLSAAQPQPLASSPSSEPCHENSTPGWPSRSASRQSRSPVTTMKPRVPRPFSRDLAREVKLADLADNLANKRRLASTPDVVAQIDRYEQAIRRLQSSLRRTPQRTRPDGGLG